MRGLAELARSDVRDCAGEKADYRFPRITPHDLRHTTASLAISAGANVKAVERMLGHASAAMTLDTSADLFEDDLDTVSIELEAARRGSSSVPATGPFVLSPTPHASAPDPSAEATVRAKGRTGAP